MRDSFAQDYLDDARSTFRVYRKLADRAIEQLSDKDCFLQLDQESNSVAIIMKHIAGNMLSRFTDFLTSDGEKPDRNRDSEFLIDPETTRAELLAYWDRGWNCLFSALEPLQSEDLGKTITIRGQEHTVVQAINRQMTHYASHIGQIVFLAKHLRSNDWKSLSIPRNHSAQFNAYLQSQSGPTDKEKQLETAIKFAEDSKTASE